MPLQVFNTLSRKLELFKPIDPQGKKVGMYCCGPTVHDFAHIGNFRTFVFADLLRRFLEFSSFEVTHVMNITDVEDKIIARVKQQNIALKDYTQKYEAAFLEDLQALNCKVPHQTPRATEHIPEIIDLIQRLMDRGIAYLAGDNSIYFSIDKYQGCGCRYGQLLNLNFAEMRTGERVSSDEYAKDSAADFALWKARVPEDGAVFWESPWGEGRPGWHIECSAMSMRTLGATFDLHLGGEDLIFPHNEDEIAQSEGSGLQAPGQRFVNYWMHGAHLLVEGKKMSKSLGNFFTLRDLLGKGYKGREIRFLLVSAHYREQFNFTIEGLDGARTSLQRIDECLAKLKELARGANGEPEAQLLQSVTDSLNNDLNVSAAWATVFDSVRECNRLLSQNTLTAPTAASKYASLREALEIFGIEQVMQEEQIPAELEALLAQRQEARKSKDFKRSDAIRDELKSKGWVIEDTPKGPRLKKV